MTTPSSAGEGAFPPPPGWANQNPPLPTRSKVIALVALVVMAGLLFAFCDDPLAIPTTNEQVVRQDLVALRPAGAAVVKRPNSNPFDCKDGPAAAWMTLRFRGDRDHAELEMRRVASRAGWLMDTEAVTRQQGADLGSFYRPRRTAGAPSFFVDFTVHGSFTDARVETVGQLGQECGVD